MNVGREIARWARATVKLALLADREGGMRISLAESCTGGLLSAALTAVPGVSAVYPGGFVTYSNEAKISLLGVSELTLQTQGAVSERCALEMAQGSLRRMDADIALSITGIAGPAGGTREKPVGLVWFGLAKRSGFCSSRRRLLTGRPRDRIRHLSVLTALQMLYKNIKDQE